MSEPILQFFRYEHLPENLQAISKPFCELAVSIVSGMQNYEADKVLKEPLPRNAERTVALRKLLEAKDAAVRAFLFKE